MTKLKISDVRETDEASLDRMSRAELLTYTKELRVLTLQLADQLSQDSTNSSRPPSSDNPYKRAERRGNKADDAASPAPSAEISAPAKKKSGRRPGKQPGAPGFWRTQPLIATAEDVNHLPPPCGCCANSGGDGKPRQISQRKVSAHFVCELERGQMGLQITVTKHYYYAVVWACGCETIVEPGVGLCSEVDGRKRNLIMSERGMVGPMLATFIAALSLRHNQSRGKIAEFLKDWLGLELSEGTIDRCIHEFGCASEPVVEELLKEVRAAEVVHLDETPWWQNGVLLWMWVAVTSNAVVYHIGSRRKEELVKLIGEAFFGWIVSDGYIAYRDHERRQRCLAHLIRKALGLAEGADEDSARFGKRLMRDLRRLIKEVAESDGASGVSPAAKRLIKSIKWNCQCNQYEVEDKVRKLAREILNDWDAVIAFVNDPRLPPTNNDAERALRCAVIARRISFGTRTDEGSRFYAAGLSVIETCRKRGVDLWAYVRDLIAAARKGAELPKIPDRAVLVSTTHAAA
jgi:transposase